MPASQAATHLAREMRQDDSIRNPREKSQATSAQAKIAAALPFACRDFACQLIEAHLNLARISYEFETH